MSSKRFGPRHKKVPAPTRAKLQQAERAVIIAQPYVESAQAALARSIARDRQAQQLPAPPETVGAALRHYFTHMHPLGKAAVLLAAAALTGGAGAVLNLLARWLTEATQVMP